MSKILITGGLGYIGSKLIRLLLKKNYKITVIDTKIFRTFGSVEEIFGGNIAKKNFIAFSRYVNPSMSLELENYAFERACEAMCVDVPADWHALRAAKRTQLGFDTMDKPTLSAIPELSPEPFKPLTKEEAEEMYQARLAQKIRDNEAARLQAIEDKKKFDEERLNRYLPTIEEFKDVAEPSGETCAYIFSTDHEGATARTHCPYDRKSGSPFCSMCEKMVAMAVAKNAEKKEVM